MRKDKEIIFTGCSYLFEKLVPKLCETDCLWILGELAELNNQLYFFHPSYNLVKYYSLLLSPLKDAYEEPIFRKNLSVIAEKCLSTNIVTPFLFGIMRNYSHFVEFIQKANS